MSRHDQGRYLVTWYPDGERPRQLDTTDRKQALGTYQSRLRQGFYVTCQQHVGKGIWRALEPTVVIR